MGPHQGSVAGAGGPCRRDGEGQPAVRGGRAVSLSGRHSVAGLARAVWRSGNDPYAVQPMGKERGLGAGFHLTGGQEHDLAGADALLPELEAETLIADKAFDADQRVLEPLAEAGKTAVIPPRTTRKTARAFDKDLYKARHLIENFFAKLKQFRAIATRYDKTAQSFLAGIHLAAALIWLN